MNPNEDPVERFERLLIENNNWGQVFRDDFFNFNFNFAREVLRGRVRDEDRNDRNERNERRQKKEKKKVEKQNTDQNMETESWFHTSTERINDVYAYTQAKRLPIEDKEHAKFVNSCFLDYVGNKAEKLARLRLTPKSKKDEATADLVYQFSVIQADATEDLLYESSYYSGEYKSKVRFDHPLDESVLIAPFKIQVKFRFVSKDRRAANDLVERLNLTCKKPRLDFDDVFNNEKFSDFVIRVAEVKGEKKDTDPKFYVSRAVLAAGSQYFRACLNNTFTEAEKGESYFNEELGATVEHVEGFLKFIYFEKLQIVHEADAQIYAKIANYYQVEALRRLAVRRLLRFLNSGNALDNLNLSEVINSVELKKAAINCLHKSVNTPETNDQPKLKAKRTV